MAVQGDFLSPAEWRRAAKRAAEAAGIACDVDILDYSLRPLRTSGGFLGEHHLAAVTVIPKDSPGDTRILRFFVKGEPSAFPTQKWITDRTLSFRKEVFALEELFPKVRASLRDGGRDAQWTCACFFTRSDIVILEDLSAGYATLENRGPIAFEYVALTMRALANMHSASVVYEETRGARAPGGLGAEHPQMMAEAFFVSEDDHPGALWLRTCVEVVWTMVERIRGKGALRRLKGPLKEAMDLVFLLQQPSERFRNAMGHGDIKRDNILYRHEGGAPVDAKIVDFQLLRYAPPANDVMCHLHIATDRKFRVKHSARLLQIYHQQFSQNLQRNGLNPEEVFPWKEFQESCDYYKALGVTIAPCYASFTFFKPEHVAHVFASDEAFRNFTVGSRISEVTKAFETDPVYKQLMTDIIEELIEFVESKGHEKFLVK